MTNLKKRLELARLLRMFAEATAEDGTLFVYEGELEVGNNVYTPNAEGELVPVADGTYKVDGKTVEVKDGTIAEVKEEIVEEVVEEEFEDTPAAEEEPAKEEEFEEEPAEEVRTTVEDELHTRIAELEAELAEKDARIAELETELVKANEPAEEPIEEKFAKVDEPAFNLRQYVKKIKNK